MFVNEVKVATECILQYCVIISEALNFNFAEGQGKAYFNYFIYC